MTMRLFLLLAAAASLGLVSEASSLIRPAIFEGGFAGFVYSNTISNNSDEWSGMDVDIVRYLCNLTTPDGYPSWVVSPEQEPFLQCTPLDQAVITTSIDERLAAVIDGEADFSIGAISWTPEREKLVDFIRPFYFATGTELLGIGDTKRDWRDLKGETLCTYPGHPALEALKSTYGIKRYVEVSGKVQAAQKIQNGECLGLIVDGAPSSSGPLKVLSKNAATIGATPYGIVVKKNASEELVNSLTAAAVSMLWAGRISPMWSIAESTFSPPDGAQPVVNVDDILQYPISAITGFLTRNGNALDWRTAPVVNGSRSVPSPGNPINATIVVYRGNALPLASIKGNISFLEDGSLWKGIEIEMLQVICSSSIIQCTKVLVADTVDERLDFLVDGKADISIGSIVVNQQRLSQGYFVQPFYFSAGPALYVPVNKSDSVPENATLDYMNGENVCTVTNSAQNPAGEKYGANLIAFETRAEAEAAIYAGDCIGLLWVSHVQFDGLIEVASDTSMDDPIGIAVRPGLPVGAYSYLSALSSMFMSQGVNSKLLKWEEEYKGSATSNSILRAVTDAITNFEPSYAESSTVIEALETQETTESPTTDHAHGSSVSFLSLTLLVWAITSILLL